MPVTLKELAVRARVHPSTISRVANHDPSLRIAQDTRQRIEALLKETEYRPNGVARGLKLRQTFVLAVVIPDITNPFFAALFRGVEDGASPHGYNVLLCNTDGSPERQRSHLQSLQTRRVDGVILASSFLKDPTVRWLRHQHIPYVLVNRFSDEGQDPFVGSDDRVGGQVATAHLAELSHRRIGHLAGKPTVSTGAAERLFALEDRPTAIFAVTDMAAVGAYGVARRMGLRVPEDVAIVGYNDIPLASRMVPALTTVHVPIHDFGSVAAQLLLEQIETGEPTRRRMVFNPELIVRGSTVAGADNEPRLKVNPAFATE